MSFSEAAAAAAAAAECDSCIKATVEVIVVLLVKFAVGSAMMVPPERTTEPRELTRERRRGNAMSRSAGDGRNEVALVDAPGDTITDGLRISRDSGKLGSCRDVAIVRVSAS